LFFLFKRIDDIAYFISFSDIAEFGYFTVDNNDNYSNVRWYSFEDIRNKTDNIKDNETSSVNYPSIKGVVDYVDEGHEVIVNALLNLEERKQNNLTFDDVPTADSDNPVKSKGIKKELNTLDKSIQDINNVIPSGTSSNNKLINESQKGAANGIASLGPNGKVLGEQLNFTFRGRINASMINDNSLEAGMYSIIGQNISGIFNNANGCLIQISDEYHTQILCVGRAPGTAEGTVVETFVRRYLNSANSWTEWSNSLRSYYTKTQIDSLIQTINQFKYEIYASLQDITNPKSNVLYLIGPTGEGVDKYEEYVYVINDFQKIGDTSIDLTNYVTTTTLMALLEGKQDVLTFDATPTVNSSNPVTSGGVKTAIDNIKVFKVIYGETRFEDTVDAYNAGKFIYAEDENGIVYNLYQAVKEDNNIVEFAFINLYGDGNDIAWFEYQPSGFSELNNSSWEERIEDLHTIRSGAAAGATAYQKPSAGIPIDDIAQGVIPDVSNFITRSVNDLTNYYLKDDTYTKAEVRGLISAIQQFHYEIYASLQDITTPATNVLYLIGPSGSGNDRYEEYVYANDDFQKIGDTSIDLSGYVTTQALNTALANYITSTDLATLLSGKQDKIDATHKLNADLVDDSNSNNKFVTITFRQF